MLTAIVKNAQLNLSLLWRILLWNVTFHRRIHHSSYCIVKTHSVDLYDRSVHTGSTCIILQRNRKCSEVSFSKLSHKMSLICDCNCHTLASIHSWQFHRRSPTTVKAVLTDTLMGAVISPLNIWKQCLLHTCQQWYLPKPLYFRMSRNMKIDFNTWGRKLPTQKIQSSHDIVGW